MIDESQIRAHLRLLLDRHRTGAEQVLADHDSRDCDDPLRPELRNTYHQYQGAIASYTDLLRLLDTRAFHPAGRRMPDTDRVHVDTDQVIRVRLHDELFQEIADRVRKDCPDLPEWKITGITADIFTMLLGRSLEFLFPGDTSG